MKKISFHIITVFLLTTATSAQYAVRIPDGKACGMITRAQLKIYLGKLDGLVKLAQQDKDKYGTTGAYPATAVHFHLYASIAYDSLKVTIDW
ncbi:MAG: hypothetical protein J0L56_08165, partial [Chitinophagales bacterium]|nr:hypothetical protein [Chitinophagales bacterium]